MLSYVKHQEQSMRKLSPDEVPRHPKRHYRLWSVPLLELQPGEELTFIDIDQRAVNSCRCAITNGAATWGTKVKFSTRHDGRDNTLYIKRIS